MSVKSNLGVQRIIDLSLDVGMVPGAKFHYKWYEYAQWQVEALKKVGLEPQHKLLDIGCGPLRFGLLGIEYLDDGGYFGMDVFPPFIELGKALYKESGLSKSYQVLEDANFEFSRFNNMFDYAMSQSVFTHLSKDQVERCLKNLKNVMNPGGQLLFTNIVSAAPRGFLYSSKQPMFTGVNMDETFYRGLCSSLEIEFVPHVMDHPTQHVHIIKF